MTIPLPNPEPDHFTEMLEAAARLDPWPEERDEALEWELRIALSDPDFLDELRRTR